ncbi:MAG TPA: T9SS type A sorting domain-containing protein [Fluviicola sp.]|nr:T9SS type A sorting domain-containing protein [Fluviicola sp.]
MRTILTLVRCLLVFAIITFAGLSARAQVIVVATAGTPGPTPYINLGAAFAAINAGTHQGNIGIGIASNTTETGPCVLNGSGAGAASYTGIAIGPTVDGVTISGTTATGRGLIELKGADNVIIEGDNPNTGGTNRNLTITNTAVNTETFTSCIRICNAAGVVTSSDNNIIRNCILNGSATGRNVAGATSQAASEGTTFGIYVGGNGGATDTDAPTALISATGASIPAATTVNNLIITNNAITSCARAIMFVGSATTSSTGVTITDNTIGTAGTLVGAPPFTAITSTVYLKGIWIAGTNALTVTGNTIQNQLSYITGPMSCIELNANIGNGTLNISNNIINGVCNNNATATNVKGILVSNAAGAYTISGNQITNIQGILSGIASTTTVVGIEMNTVGSGTVELNKITQIYNRNTGTTGAFGINLLGGNNHVIRNNFISDLNQNMSGGYSFSPLYCVLGIRINAGTGHQVYYNSVNLSGTLFGTANSDLLTACLAVSLTGSTGMDIRNNVFSNTLSGGTTNLAHVSIHLPSGGTSAMNLIENNNAYFCGSLASQGIAQVGTTVGTGFYTAANFAPGATTPATNLRAYTSTLSVAGTNDNASVASTAAVPYTSLSDLHIDNAAPTAILLDATAAPIVSITTDIDGAARNATTPDMGADEFIMPLCSSANGGTITPATYAICDGQTVSLSSAGATTGSGITYQWMVSTVSGGPYTNVSGGTGATTVSYVSGALTAGTYYYVLATTCSAGPTTGLSNEVTVTVNALPTVGVSPSTAFFCNPGPAVTLTASGANTYSWSPAAGLSATTGASVDASPSSSTVYTVTGTDGNGCINTATSTITTGAAVTGATANATAATICEGDAVDLSSSANPFPLTIFTENFNSGAPTWTRTNSSTGGTPANAAWTDRPDGYSYAGGTAYHSNDNSQFVQSNSDSQGSGSTTNVTLQSPSFNTTGLTGLTMNFYHYYRDIADAGDSAVVEFSTNGTNWTIAGSYTANTGSENAFASATVALPAAFENQPTVYARFRYRATWDWYWSIDNVSIVGNSTNFTYSWTSTPGGFTSSVQNPTGVTPTVSTTYDVLITAPSGCSSTASTTVTVNALPTVVANTTASAICDDGSSVTLTGSGATSYMWDNGVTDNVAFSPTTTTTYTVTGTDGNGCQNTDQVTVTVNALPVVDAGTDQTVCEGTSVTLAGSGATTYIWDNSVTDNVAFTATTTTTYTVTGTDGNGCTNTDDVLVTVNTLPVVVANTTASAICNDGSSVTLTGSGATTYSWDNGVTDNVAFSPTTTTTYMVTGTDTNGCENTDQVTVTVNALPTVVANTTDNSICAGESVTLTGSGASSYTWDNGVTDGVATTPSTTTTYTVTGTDGNGCENTDAITVTVNSAPTATATDNGDASITASAGTSYQWVNCGTGTAIAGATSQTYTATANGDYAVVVTNASGCSDTSSCVTIDYISLAEIIDASIQVYPNPTSGEVFVTMSATEAKVDVIDAQGKVLQVTTVSNGEKVSLAAYETGVYFLRIVTENGSTLARIVKQ